MVVEIQQTRAGDGLPGEFELRAQPHPFLDDPRTFRVRNDKIRVAFCGFTAEG